MRDAQRWPPGALRAGLGIIAMGLLSGTLGVLGLLGVLEPKKESVSGPVLAVFALAVAVFAVWFGARILVRSRRDNR